MPDQASSPKCAPDLSKSNHSNELLKEICDRASIEAEIDREGLIIKTGENIGINILSPGFLFQLECDDFFFNCLAVFGIRSTISHLSLLEKVNKFNTDHRVPTVYVTFDHEPIHLRLLAIRWTSRFDHDLPAKQVVERIKMFSFMLKGVHTEFESMLD
jgi:hypothetical protein